MGQPDATIAVSEVFGPTHQGEGPSAGQPAVFLRLAGCNLKCSWCDTPYTWNWATEKQLLDDAQFNDRGRIYPSKAEIHSLRLGQVFHLIQGCAGRAGLLVITGGEPLLQEKAVGQVAQWWISRDLYNNRVEIETNGTIAPKGLSDAASLLSMQFNVSPKLGNSGEWNDAHQALREGPLQWFAHERRATFKFVIQQHADLVEVEELVSRLAIPARRVYLMPEAKDAHMLQDRMAWIMPYAAERGWSVTTRLHIMAYGVRRGV